MKVVQDHLDIQFDKEVEKLNTHEPLVFSNTNIRRMTPEELQYYREKYPELYHHRPRAKSFPEILAQQTRDIAINRSDAVGRAVDIMGPKTMDTKITEHFANIEDILMGNKNGINEYTMPENEYTNRRAQLGVSIPNARNPSEMDIHDQKTSLKSFVIQRIRSTDMPPMATSVIFRVKDPVAPVIMGDHDYLKNLYLKHQPFTDYTLAFDMLSKFTGSQYDFIRVFRHRGDLTLAVFSIDLYGEWNFKYTVPLIKFKFHQGVYRVHHSDITLGAKDMESARNSISMLHYLESFVIDAQKQYMRLAQFLKDFQEFDIEPVIQVLTIPELKNRSRTIQDTYVEYTLDMSKSKRVKRIEAEERERAKWVKEEPKTREHERVGHKRRLSDGRVIKVRGTTINKGSPLGKIVKDYKLK